MGKSTSSKLSPSTSKHGVQVKSTDNVASAVRGGGSDELMHLPDSQSIDEEPATLVIRKVKKRVAEDEGETLSKAPLRAQRSDSALYQRVDKFQKKREISRASSRLSRVSPELSEGEGKSSSDVTAQPELTEREESTLREGVQELTREPSSETTKLSLHSVVWSAVTDAEVPESLVSTTPKGKGGEEEEKERGKRAPTPSASGNLTKPDGESDRTDDEDEDGYFGDRDRGDLINESDEEGSDEEESIGRSTITASRRQSASPAFASRDPCRDNSGLFVPLSLYRSASPEGRRRRDIATTEEENASAADSSSNQPIASRSNPSEHGHVVTISSREGDKTNAPESSPKHVPTDSAQRSQSLSDYKSSEDEGALAVGSKPDTHADDAETFLASIILGLPSLPGPVTSGNITQKRRSASVVDPGEGSGASSRPGSPKRARDADEDEDTDEDRTSSGSSKRPRHDEETVRRVSPTSRPGSPKRPRSEDDEEYASGGSSSSKRRKSGGTQDEGSGNESQISDLVVYG